MKCWQNDRCLNPHPHCNFIFYKEVYKWTRSEALSLLLGTIGTKLSLLGPLLLRCGKNFVAKFSRNDNIDLSKYQGFRASDLRILRRYRFFMK